MSGELTDHCYLVRRHSWRSGALCRGGVGLRVWPSCPAFSRVSKPRTDCSCRCGRLFQNVSDMRRLGIGPGSNQCDYRKRGYRRMTFLALLASSTLFGGMVLYSFGFAPLVFKNLAADEAGRMLRRAFPWYYLFVLASSAVGAAAMATFDRASCVMMIFIAGIAVYARQRLMPNINMARDQQVSGHIDAANRFARLHGVSVLLNFAQLIGAAWVLYRFS